MSVPTPLDPELVQIGDIVRSRWSNSGVKWRVVEMTDVHQPYLGSKPARILELRSLASSRERTEKTWNLTFVRRPVETG